MNIDFVQINDFLTKSEKYKYDLVKFENTKDFILELFLNTKKIDISEVYKLLKKIDFTEVVLYCFDFNKKIYNCAKANEFINNNFVLLRKPDYVKFTLENELLIIPYDKLILFEKTYFDDRLVYILTFNDNIKISLFVTFY